MPDNAEKLIKLISMGLERFGQLSTAEVKLFRAAANGEVAEFRVGNGALNHPAYANQWGGDRWLEADRIAWLCGISNTENLLTKRGILIRGAKISGALRLDYVIFDAPLAFSHCAFNDTISLQHAKTRMLKFQLTHCKSINATGIQVDGPVYLTNGFRAFSISLNNAQITGDFHFKNSRLKNPGGEAIRANGLEVKGTVDFSSSTIEGGVNLYQAQIFGDLLYCDSKLCNAGREAIRAIGIEVKGTLALSSSKINGCVNLYQAKILGNLDCYESKLCNAGGDALLATGINVGGAIFLSGVFLAIGRVNLNFATIDGNLDCQNGHFMHRPKIEDKDAQVSALDLQCTNIKGYALLRNGFQCDGSVNFVKAIVGAHLDCQGGRFLNPGGYAILGNNARISNGLILRNGFYAEGEVRLFAATIDGNLECSGGQFVNPKGNALNAERADVSGHMLLNVLFRADGAVRLNLTTVRGDLRCDGGQFVNPTGNALEMVKANVNGDVFLCHGFRAEGMVRLLRVTIGSNLECSGGEFYCPEGKNFENPPAGLVRYALEAESANIGGSVLLRPGLKGENTGKPFIADGTVYLLNTRVGGNVECQGCAFRNENGYALVLVGAQIAGDLILGPGFHAHGRLDLSRLRIDGDCRMLGFVEAEKITSLDVRFSKVTTMEHVPDSWPKSGQLLLDGLVYKNVFIGPPFHGGWKNFLEWLRLQPTEPRALQPYEQLADVLKSNGYESDATEVLIAKQDDLRRYGDLGWWAKFCNRVLGFIIGHGYKPHRAFLFMIYFVWLGAAVSYDGYRNHLITTSNEANYPKFQPFIYSLDCFLPFIDLKQKNAWSPNANKGYEIVMPRIWLRVRWGGLLRAYLCVHTLLGWALTTLWVAGFTGLVRRLN